MFLKRSTLRKIILENLLKEEVFSAAATGIVWQNIARGMGGAVTTHGRSLLSAASQFSTSLGSSAPGLSTEFAKRAGARAIMNHNMQSLTTALNRAGGETAFNALRSALGPTGQQFAWQGGRMVFVGAGEKGAELAIVYGSGFTAASVGLFLLAIAAAFTVPALAIYEFSTMKILDKRLKNLHRASGPVGELKPVAPFSGGQFDIDSTPGKELTGILPLIFQGYGKGTNAILRKKAALPPGKLGETVEAAPAALAMGNKIIELINDGTVDKNDLSERYYKVFIVPIIKARKDALSTIKSQPPIESEAGSKGEKTKAQESEPGKTGSPASSRIKKIQKIINDGPSGKWTKDTNIKLGAYATAESLEKVTTKPAGLEWWKSWKNSAPQIKSMSVAGKTMSFGAKKAGNPQLKGNLSSLLKVLEFIKDSRVQL